MNTRIPPQELAHRCDPAAFSFSSTQELADLDTAIGQSRAAEAIRFGVDIDREGYNLFVMGPPGSGRHALVRRMLDERAANADGPPDWVYVNNFDDPQRPIAIDLPAGGALRLRDDIRALVEELRAGIPAAFESDEYSSRIESIDAEFKERHEKVFNDLGEEAGAQQLALLRTPGGFAFAPVRDGEIMGPEVFAKLPEAEQHTIEKAIPVLQEKLEKIMREVMRWRKERVERIKSVNQEMTMMVTGHLVEELRLRYVGLSKVVGYLDALQADVLENADDFRKPAEGEQPLLRFVQTEEGPLRRYLVNVLVEHAPPGGSPIVETDHPTHQNIVGRIDHLARFGTLVTDFSQIKAGDLHRANGGFLLLDAARLLGEPFAWAGLKRALLRREIRIESLSDMYGGLSTVSLAPQPIPLKLKVILFGERRLYYLLQEYDPDCAKLFRVVADFADELDRSAEADLQYARLAGGLARREGLLPLSRAAVAGVIDLAARRAGDARKLSADLRSLDELLKEADFHARSAKRSVIEAQDVTLSDQAQRRRASRLHEGMQEAVVRGKLLIDTEGSKVGQVNGLSVFELGDHAFGQPTRITATTRPGEGQIIDIQREVQMGGAIHSKGVMILAAYLGSRYSGSRPLSLCASLVFEQTYGTVDGDSASLAELCALLSSLSGSALLQSIAVTGSINQFGEVQAIGAVNEKVESFFDLCATRGLSGRQGVIIPAANVDNLLLREEVVAAAAAGRFHIHAVRTADEAIELLTATPAGEAYGPDDSPGASVNARVLARLRKLSQAKLEQSRAVRRGPAAPQRRKRGAD